jgi:chemotaxis protein MotA
VLVIVGYVVVLASVFGGYALAGGHLAALLQPVELLMIGGAAMGAFIVGNGMKAIKATLKALPSCLKGSKYTKAMYMELMALLYDILAKVRKEGLMTIENDVEEPQSSPLFTKYPSILANPNVLEFITDYLRLMVGGNLNTFEIENLMDNEIETHHHEGEVPVHVLARLGDAMPAFGILLAYGFVSPLASLLEQKLAESTKMLECIKVTVLASLNGYSPALAVEFGRKVLFSTERPSFAELENHVKRKPATAAK